MIDGLFSDRAWGLKLLCTGVLFAALCHVHLAAMHRVRPSEAAIDHPAPSHLGGLVRRWGLRVTAVDPSGFGIELDSGPVWIRSSGPPVRVGDVVGFSARLEAPRVLRADDVAVIEGYAWKRSLNYAVSVAVVLLVLWQVRGRFRGRPSAGLFHGRT
ncbi:MAG TPA: hypothetical protein VEJ18_15350 [Planctomycetota bacterium]|nr:hypothetical protein [Planctomycetota bacterium]